MSGWAFPLAFFCFYFCRFFSRHIWSLGDKLKIVPSYEEVSTNRLARPDQHELFFQKLVFDGGYDHIVFILHDESVFKHRLGKFAS